MAEPDILALPVKHAVRQHARQLVGRIAAASKRLEDGKDDEALHDFRVALRRLRTFGRAFTEQLPFTGKTTKRLRKLARATSGPRDVEITLRWVASQREQVPARARPGVDWLMRRLETEHEQAEGHLSSHVVKDWKRIEGKLIARLDAPFADEIGAARFDAEIRRVLDQHAETLHKRLTHAEKTRGPEALHAARIAAKHLRYLIEPLRDSVAGADEALRRLKSFQDTLGELNDAHVILSRLRSSAAECASQRALERYDLELAEGDGSPAVRALVRRDPRRGIMGLARLAQERLVVLERQASEAYFADRAQVLLEPAALVTRNLSGAESTVDS